MRPLIISSPTNQTIKDLARLKDRKGDRAERSFIVEGRREIERAIVSGFKLEDFFYCPDELDEQSHELLSGVSNCRMAEVSKEAFSKVATRDGADGLLAIFAQRVTTFADILKRANDSAPFIVAVEDIEKPGNLGAVLRSADGAGVHGIVVLGKSVDTWNSNVIRSSLGGVFSVPVVHSETNDFFAWCESESVVTVAAALSDRSKSVYETSLIGPLAIILGSEALGLSDLALNRANHLSMVPMNGICDSLNISVAASVMMYEALRQRALESRAL